MNLIPLLPQSSGNRSVPCGMRRRAGRVFVLAWLCGGSVLAQTPAPSPEPAPVRAQPASLPVERVVLSNAGVGFFQHAGTVRGDSAIELSFTPDQLNDVLKSLVVEDAAGAGVPRVTYAGQEPLERLLASFAIDLSAQPSLRELLSQLRGAELRVVLEGSEMLVGRVLGTELRPQSQGDAVVDAAWVTIAGAGGIRSVELNLIRSFELVDPALQRELERALDALAQARSTQKRPLRIRFPGAAERRVTVGYVVEAPVWKTSYRLLLPRDGAGKGAAALQAWAIVENTTEQDWENVELALVSGRPLAFIEDLYEPQYVQRPVHRPQRFTAIGPQAYEAGFESEAKEAAAESSPRRSLAMAPAPMMAPAAAPSAPALAERGAPDFAASVRSAAEGRQLGTSFQYSVRGVHVARHGSAMLPVVAAGIEATPVSIYDAAVLVRHPLRGARLVNTTGGHLPAGPLTVLEGDTYAGDATIDELPPGGERLLSFAVDLDVTVQRRDPGTETTLVGARIERGVLQLQQKRVRRTVLALRNEASVARQLWLGHPVAPGWELAPDTPAPRERTEAQVRFVLDLPAGASREFTVEEGRTDWESVRIGILDERTILGWAGNGQLPQAVRDALSKVAELRREVVTAERAVQETQRPIAEITAEQERIRANLQTLQRGTPLHERLVAKLNSQETELENHGKTLTKARERLARAQSALESHLAGLTIE